MPNQSAEEDKKAWIYSLRVLNVAAKSRRRMSERLKEKGYSEEVAVRVLTELEKLGYLNDRQFAQSLFSQLTRLKSCGRSKIVFELKRKGLPEETWEPLLKEYSDDDEYAQGLEIARRKWRSANLIEIAKRKKKVHDFLIRKGYSFQLAFRILTTVSQAGEEL